MSETSAVVEKSLRSVFVGNIPYEATEEKLKDIFNQVGPVVSFKLMHDRESGKPRGYGFCEYKDQETALSAMRNLNGFEIGGRSLRVDNACTEKSRMEMQSLMMGPVVESPYGPDVEPNQAPEAISNAVASLPPEQMFELMRQMQVCVRSNRTEARTMLLNNPQLAYALLQAQPRQPCRQRDSNPGLSARKQIRSPIDQAGDSRPSWMEQRDPRGRDEPRGGPDRDFRAPPPDPIRDPRGRGGPPSSEDFPRGPPSSNTGPPSGLPANITSGLAGHDQEKASLIMQVLQLSDEQIRMLPPEQQASILQLKEQIQQSQH
ncbi:RNA recognition motif domain [Trinorchestia longiramus]|nr:RNA recognition motif domain [Trinorchestia longiramus]